MHVKGWHPARSAAADGAVATQLQGGRDVRLEKKGGGSLEQGY